MRKKIRDVRLRYGLTYLALLFLMFLTAVPSLLSIPFGTTYEVEAYAAFPTDVMRKDDFAIMFPVEMITFEMMDEELRMVIQSSSVVAIGRTMNDQVIYVEFGEEDGTAVVIRAGLEKPETSAYIEAEYQSVMIDEDFNGDEVTMDDIIGIRVSYPWPDHYRQQGHDDQIVEGFKQGSVIYSIRIWRGRFLVQEMSPMS